MDALDALLALRALPGLGPLRLRALLEAYGEAPAVLRSSQDSLRRVPGIGPELARIISHWQDHADPTRERELARHHGLHFLLSTDPNYPQALRELRDPPPLLSAWGKVEPQDALTVGLVGTRTPSHSGRQTARKFAYQLANCGLTILSGLARGIDAAAHEGALAAGGRTIALLGSGLRQLYPAENLPLAEKIASGHGAVLSEYPLEAPPSRAHFPQRNRLVAGWSQALIVVEAARRSGSRITANLATESGRPVFAIPGPIERPQSAGCHDLIREGAILLSEPAQLFEDLPHLHRPHPPSPEVSTTPPPPPDLSPIEARLLAALEHDQASIETLLERSGLSPAQATPTLLHLELRGLVQSLPGNLYAKS